MDESSIPNSGPRDPAMYQVDVADDQDVLTIDVNHIVSTVRKTLHAEQVARASISIAVVDNATIRRVNRQFLDHDYETDVLSFLLEEPAEGSGTTAIPRGAGKALDGEVIVSAEYAAAMADSYGWEPADELTLYVVHGLLHLCGYDDLDDSEVAVMRNREREILALLGLGSSSASRREAADKESADRSTDTTAGGPM